MQQLNITEIKEDERVGPELYVRKQVLLAIGNLTCQ